jgi:hypothetical protein
VPAGENSRTGPESRSTVWRWVLELDIVDPRAEQVDRADHLGRVDADAAGRGERRLQIARLLGHLGRIGQPALAVCARPWCAATRRVAAAVAARSGRGGIELATTS